MTKYSEAAETGYKVLLDQYRTANLFNGDFWFGGNTLHTCLNYLLAAGRPDSEEILNYAYYKVFKPLLSNPCWWRDDYSWWGNAFTLAISGRDPLGYSALRWNGLFNDLWTAAGDCWRMLQCNWGCIPYMKASDNAAAESSLEIKGGTFNTYFQPPMSGRNSVTNEGFWLLSQGLARLDPKNSEYPTYASNEAGWFKQWLAYPGNNDRQNGILNKQGLVLERPLGNGTASTWYWSGDQGLYMQALTLTSPDANTIAKAVVANMTDKDGVFHENMSFSEQGDLGQFVADYATGKGILMRGIGLLNVMPPSGSFSSVVRANAKAVWCNRSTKTNQFTFNWNWLSFPKYEPKELRVGGKTDALCDLIMQTAGLEALTAAIRAYPNEQIPSC